ncbi:MAG: flagellar protein export ATPase FliI [Gammaproteobacteria bacterium]|nr:flagellar protein export ATPase FliI [Gammaproteobacteria bacterium]
MEANVHATDPLIEKSTAAWREALDRVARLGKSAGVPVVEGVLTRMVGLTLEASGCQAPIGASCDIVNPGGHRIETEVVGFSGDSLFLMPTNEVRGLVPNARVIPTRQSSDIRVGPEMLGRVIDGGGRPLDGKGPIYARQNVPLQGHEINPLERTPIREVLDVGVRAINALTTIGRGQRMGLFAGSGVGKSVLLGMMTKFTEADIVVVGLIGERGREVKEFVEEILGEEGLKKSVVVAAPADASPLLRIHGAMQATSIAEYFRDEGKHVLLLMDSLTRFAQAQREIALAIGEPPATKGYPPSVFARLPQLVERAGNGNHGSGSITAFYTVLVEGDDHADPIADSARAILDGHIVLSRQIAESGQYPAIDIEASISRLAPVITDQQHLKVAQQFKRIYSLYQQNRDLINLGAYQPGSDPSIDRAISMQPQMNRFLAQDMHEPVTFKDSYAQLMEAVSTPVEAAERQDSTPVSTEALAGPAVLNP